MKNTLVLFAMLAAVAGCTTDPNGNTCNFLSAYVNSDGDAYCPDEDAPDDCEELKSAVVDSLVECGALQDDAQTAADDALPCEKAVATTKDFDECLDQLDGDCVTSLPAPCKGAILADENK